MLVDIRCLVQFISDVDYITLVFILLLPFHLSYPAGMGGV